jgi:chaperonin GroEL
MIVKDISFGDEARGALITGINKIANAVKSTLGARGRTVLIESTEHVGGITVTKDGVTVANSINLMDPTENLAVVMMRQAASKTASEAGDGTTTAIVLAQALIHEAQTRIKPEMNLTQIMRAIQSSSDYILKLLTDMSDQVNEDRLLDVASISANNDSEIGEIIYNAYNNVGNHGVVTVENAQGSETYCTVSEGMRS